MSWRTVTFEDAPLEIIDGDRGKNYPSQNQLLESGYCLFLSATNVTKDGFVFEHCQFITQEKHEALRKGTVNRGDVILTTRGTLGNVAYYSESVPFPHVRINSGMVTIKSDPAELLSSYVYYYLKSDLFQSQVRALQSGAAQPQLPIRDIKKIKFNYPDLPTQQRIAAILSAYDDLIENNRRRIALLEQATRLLYREWFVHFRFPGHETAKFVDGLPVGWELVSSSVAMQINPKTVWDKTQSKQIRLFPMGALSKSGMSCNESQFEYREKSTSVRFINGDTLFARITPCLENGKTGFASFLEDGEVACGSTEFIIFREKMISKHFIYLMAREDGFRQNAITSMVGSSGRQRVQPSCFDKFMVSVPPEDVAYDFDSMVAPIFRQIQSAQKANQQLTKARDLLLPRLMDGRIPVKV